MMVRIVHPLLPLHAEFRVISRDIAVQDENNDIAVCVLLRLLAGCTIAQDLNHF